MTWRSTVAELTRRITMSKKAEKQIAPDPESVAEARQSVAAGVSNYSGGLSIITESGKIELASLSFGKDILKLGDLYYILETVIEGMPNFKNENIKTLRFTLQREDC